MKVRLIVTLLATASILALVQSTIEDDDSIILESDPEETQESDFQNTEESDPQNPEESDPQNPEESDPQNPEESDPQNPEESDPQNPEESDPEETQESDQEEPQDSDPQESEEDEQPVKSKRVEDIPGLSEDLLTKTIDEARKETLEEEAKTKRLRHHDEKPQSSLRKHFMRGHRPELEPHRVNALIKERTIRKLAQKLKMNTKNAATALEGLESPSLNSVCEKVPKIIRKRGAWSYLRYRTVDGSRNQCSFSNSGKANTPFRRLIRADYGDGLSTPRKPRNGSSELPNARFASKTLFDNANNPSKKLSHMAMIWGQFLDHDITQSAESDVDCSHECGPKGDCFGIAIPEGDNAFKGRSCIELKRNVPVCRNSKLPREQINTLSAYIDASGVYSNDEKKFEELRDPKNKALLIERKNRRGKKLLSAEQDPKAFCRSPKPTKQPCFRAGDARVNENSGLASMHTIFNREHNRIVTKLRWSRRYRNRPQSLFLEARKIVGAMIQHITYNEFLPGILSERERTRFRLRLRRRLLSEKPYFYLRRFEDRRYKPDPSIFNSFATAAYRFGHSLVQNQLNRFLSYDRNISSIPMDRFFDTSFLYQKRGVDSILRGLVRDKSQQVDGSFAKAVHERLVRFANDMADLPAVNIQRGRDHGIPGYNRFRELAGLRRAKEFSDLRDVMTNEQIKKLRKVYNHVDDIDLFAGGVYEKPCDDDGAVGKTFSFIIAQQFHNLRFGDRFWYENRGQFTPCQLREIRKSSLARVICDNSDGIKLIYPRVITPGKRRVQCRRLPKINLRAWF